jgi:integrase
MGRKSGHNLPPGIHQDQNGVYWATLEGEHAKLFRQRYPGKSLPRRKAKDIRQALKLQRQLIEDLKAARDPNAENPRVADWVRTCIDRKRKLAPSTVRRYRQSLRWQIEPHPIGRMRVAQIVKRHVEAWIDDLTAQKRQDDDTRTLDAYSIEHAFAVLRMAFNMAIAEGMIAANPCKGVELPTPEDEEINPMTPAQVLTFLSFLDTFDRGRPHRNAALYYVAIYCGLRLGELLGLRRKDIDIERREVRIAGQIQKGQRKRGKSKKAHRTVPLASDVVRILEWHLQNQIEEQNVSPEGWNKAGLVFCSETGTPLNAHNVWRQFTAFQRRVGLADACAACQATGKQGGAKCAACCGHTSIALFRTHDMRHTYAALAIAAGVDIFTLSRRMGHESITTTADKYGHLYKGQDDDAQAIERLLKRA